MLGHELRCVAVDLPGHGVLVGTPFDLDEAADHILGIARTEAGDRGAILVGLSLGGYVAMLAAARDARAVNGLVLAGCSLDPVGPAGIPFRALGALLERMPEGPLRLANFAFFRARYGRRVADALLEGGLGFRQGAVAVRSLVGRSFGEGLARFDGPVLVLNGMFDVVFRPRATRFAAHLRNARFEVLPWAAHLSNLDRPRSFAAAVQRFAREAAKGGG